MSAEAIVLVGHGARDPAWAAPLERLAAALRGRGHCVSLAYLEFMAPDIPATLESLHREGVRNVRVVPVFLGAGGHIVQEVADRVAIARVLRPELRIELERPVGERQEVVDAIASAIGNELATQL